MWGIHSTIVFGTSVLAIRANVMMTNGYKIRESKSSPTLRAGQAHDFVHTLDGMRAFNCAVGGEAGNVGLLLDAFHWWTAHGTALELRHLVNDEIVYVHLNDAQAGLDRDAQIDQAREQVGATGVIPIKPFLDALRAVGYDGPVAVEPFNAALKAMTAEEAVRATSAALDRVLAL